MLINDIITGIKKADGEYVVVPDRKEAIKYAIVNANDGDPVDLLTGEFNYTYTDLESVAKYSIPVKRYYNSGNFNTNTGFGNGWSNEYDYRAVYEDNCVIIYIPTGGQIVFKDDGTGEYTCQTDNQKELIKNEDIYFYKEKGKEYLYEILKEVDPEYAQIVHFNNVKRVIRALEYHKETGHKLSEHNKEQRQKDSPYNFAYFVLYHDREVLYDRINRRVDLMMEDGLLEEVKGLIEEGYTKDLVSMQGLGYKEFFDYFDGEMSLEETVDKVKRDTRRFAKRQLTWFRREKEVVWLNKKEYEQEKNLLDSVLNIIKEKGICNGTKR